MTDQETYLKQIRQAHPLSEKQGFVQTSVDGVHFFWVEEHVERCPIIYEAGLAIICQGHKVGYLEDEVFRYDKDNYLITSVTMPFECASYATLDDPLWGIYIDLDLSELHELVAILSQEGYFKHSELNKKLSGIETAPVHDSMRESINRLIRCLSSSLESRVMGRSYVKEIIFQALLGKHATSLYALTLHNTPYNRIAKTLTLMRDKHCELMNIDELAKQAGMSISVFHRAFKVVTGSSPLQYLKKIRLSRAKTLILYDGLKASVAATKVGYESASQFSREFKRYFGVPPSEADKIGYDR
ncbi:AraC family transcriptional regulator [Alteromonadaceae bacterium M269]|nr:AraC family transcriptional regulator [Alteromonadaceae bacterium M269]